MARSTSHARAATAPGATRSRCSARTRPEGRTEHQRREDDSTHFELGPADRSTTMTTGTATNALLDFNPTIGMVVEGAPPDDPNTDPWRVTISFAPGFAGPPLHIHPHQQESYEVLSGVLDVFIDGQWREVGPGERVTVPAGAPHTIRNLHREEMRALNVHAPALDFPDYMAALHELVHS